MLTNKRVLILTVFAILFTIKVRAQNSLGDPVFSEDFGRGTNLTPVGPALDFRWTRLDYTRNKCPGVDAFGRGQYCIAFTTSNCFDGTWRTVYENHTPNDPYGYMMIVNASEAPDVIYTNVVPGERFCPGVKYQLQVYVYNIVNELPGNDYQQPDIEFSVAKADGTPLQASTSTGKIPSTGSWVPYSVDFISPTDGSSVIITLKNKTIGSDNGNDFVLDDITVKAYGPVIDIGLGTATRPDAITEKQCLGDRQAKYYLKAFVHNFASPVYQWQSNINNGGWKNLDGKTQDHLDLETEFLNPQPGKYQYRVGALSGAGASLSCQTFSEAITINVFKTPTFSLPDTTRFCAGELLSLRADGGSSYLWTYPDGRPPSTDQFLNVSTSASKSDEGRYTVIVTENGCSKPTSTYVVVGEPLVATVDNDKPIVCEGDAVQIGANGGTTYKWDHAESLDNANIAKPIASPSVTTEYNVLVSNGFCERKQTVTVTVIKKPHADAGPDRVMMEGEPIILQGAITGDNVNHYWTSDGPIDDPTSLTPKISPTESTTYTLHAESTNDCGTVSDEVFVRVFKKLTIPTTFTPNNDGVNDTWKIDKLITYPESVLSVYTREGQEVFRTVGDAKQWNGNYQGKQLGAGVYYYVIDLKNDLPKKAGWVMLVR